MSEQEANQEVQNILDEVAALGQKQAVLFQSKITDYLTEMKAQLDSLLESITVDLQRDLSESPEHQPVFASLREKLLALGGASGVLGNEGIQASDELRQALANAEERIQELEGQIQTSAGDKIKRHIAELEQNLEKRNETINIARRRILRLQEKIEGMAAERATALQRVADFEMQMERKNAALQASEERFTDLRRKFDLKMGGNEAVSAQMLALERQVEEKNKLLHFHESRAEQAAMQADSKSGEVAKMQERVQALTAQLEEQKNEAQNHEKRIHELQEESRSLRESQKRDEKDEHDRLTALQKDAESLIEELQGKGNRLEQQNAALKEELDKYKGAVADGLGKTTAAESALNEEVARREEAQHSLEQLQTELSETKNALEQTREKISALEGTLGERDSAIDGAEKRVEEVEAKLESLMSQSGDKENELATLAGDVERYKTRVEELEAFQQQSREELQKDKEEIETLTRQIQAESQEKSAQIDNLTTQLGVADSERQEANAALVELRKEMEALRGTSYDALSEKDAALVQIKELSEKIAQLENDLSQSPTSQQLSVLETQYQEERKRADMIQEMLDQELANGTKAGLARQLADALRDLEEAREEARRIRQHPKKEEERQTVAIAVSEKQTIQSRTSKELLDGIAPDKRRNLGDALVAIGMIQQDQLSEAVQTQKMHPETSLTTVLLNQQLVRQEDIAEIISLLSNVPLISMEDIEITEEATGILPEKIARMRRCIPVRADSEEIEVAMENPMDLVAIEDIERVTNRRVVPKVALRSQIEAALDVAFPKAE